jgi:hypothetical protein
MTESRIERELRIRNPARRTISIETESTEPRSGNGHEERFRTGHAALRVDEPLLEERSSGQIAKIGHAQRLPLGLHLDKRPDFLLERLGVDGWVSPHSRTNLLESRYELVH